MVYGRLLLDTQRGRDVMDHTGLAFATLEPPTQRDQKNRLSDHLEELQIRMGIVVYDRRTIRNLIHRIEASHIDTSGQLRAVLNAAREHLEISEQFEDEENSANHNIIEGRDFSE